MKGRLAWLPPVGVAGWVLGFQLWLVAVAGTDVPFHDQWNIEGEWLYPQSEVGALQLRDLLRPLNEHRITWTHLWNLAWFRLGGQWDPLVQLVANAFPRALSAGLLAWWMGPLIGRWKAAVVVGVAFLPHLGWHNVLWGNQSQVYFAVVLSGVTLACLAAPVRSPGRTAAGLLAGLAAFLAMAPSSLVPVALMALVAVRAGAARRVTADTWGESWPALVLLAAAWSLRVDVPDHRGLQPDSVRAFLGAAGRLLAWPHEPLAAPVMILPLVLLVVTRLRGRPVVPREDFVIALGFWCGAIAFATAWMRGGSSELTHSVPSRYADFAVLLPVANAAAAFLLVRDRTGFSRRGTVFLAWAWAAFTLVGWMGISAQVMKGLVVPRARDREAPIRLVQAYQRNWDASAFHGQPLLLVPHPNAGSIRQVLTDPRLRGKLPPSLQPEIPPGRLSWTTRELLAYLRSSSDVP